MSDKSTIINAAVREAKAVKDLATKKAQESIMRELAPQIESRILEALQNPSSKTAALKAVTAQMVAEAKVNFALGEDTEVNIDATSNEVVNVDMTTSDDAVLTDSFAEEVEVGDDDEDFSLFDDEEEEEFEKGDELEGAEDDDLEESTEEPVEDVEIELETDAPDEGDVDLEVDVDAEVEGEIELQFDSFQRPADAAKARLVAEARLITSTDKATKLRRLISEARTPSELANISNTVALLGRNVSNIASEIDSLQSSKGLNKPYKNLVGALSVLQESLVSKRKEMANRRMNGRKFGRRFESDSAEADFDFDALEMEMDADVDFDDAPAAEAEGSAEAALDQLATVFDALDDLESELEAIAEVPAAPAEEEAEAEPEALTEARQRLRRRRVLEARRRQAAASRVNESRRPAPRAARGPAPRRSRRFEGQEERETAARNLGGVLDSSYGREFEDDFTLADQLTPAYRTRHGERELATARPRPAGLHEARLKRELAKTKFESAKYKAAATFNASKGLSERDRKSIVEAIGRAKSPAQLRGTFRAARLLVERTISKAKTDSARRARVITEARKRLQERKQAQTRQEYRQRLQEARERVQRADRRINESRAARTQRTSLNESGDMNSVAAWKRIVGNK